MAGNEDSGHRQARGPAGDSWVCLCGVTQVLGVGGEGRDRRCRMAENGGGGAD